MANDQQKQGPPRRGSRLWNTVASTLRDYLVNVRWKGEEDGVTAVKSLIRRGPLYWPGLAVLAFAVLAAAYLSLQGRRFPAVSTVFVDEAVQIPGPTLYLSLLVAALGWAYLLTGAIAASLGVYVLAASYATYFGLSLSQGLRFRSAWLILIPLWLLALGAWGAASHRTRWRFPLLLVLSLVAAQYTCAGLGVHMGLLPAWGLPLVAGIYFVLAISHRVAGQRPVRPALAFAVSLILFASLYSASLWSAPAGQFSPYVVFVFQYLLYFLEIFWFWLGAGLVDTARTLAGWTLSRIEAVVPRSILAGALAGLSAGWSIVFAALTYAYELEGMPAAATTGWQGAVLQAYVRLKPSLALVQSSRYHGLVNLAILVYLAVLSARKKYTHDKLLRLVGISLLAFFLLYGYFGAFYSLSGATDVLSGPQPMLLFVGLMFWEIIKAASDQATGARDRAGLLLGCLLIVASISLFELAADPGYFALLVTGTTFLGAVYLGPPYLLYTLLYEERRDASVPARDLGLVFLLGMASAIPSLVIGRVSFAPALWLLITLTTVWHRARWSRVWDGLACVLATGLGFAVYYTYPLFVPIPVNATFLNRLAQLELSYTAPRFLPWEAGWWQTVAGVLGAASVLGYSVARAKQSQGRRQTAHLLLGVLLSVALLAVLEYARVL